MRNGLVKRSGRIKACKEMTLLPFWPGSSVFPAPPESGLPEAALDALPDLAAEPAGLAADRINLSF
jgi:hypothetical protein